MHSFYGILDQGTPVTSTGNGKNSGAHGSRGRLQRQTITHEVTPAGNQRRVVSDNLVDWTSSRGWFLDLVSPDGDKREEHLVGTPRLHGRRILFTTLVPADGRCELGGRRRVMALDAENGGRTDTGLFAVGGDGEGSDADALKMPDGPSDAGPVTVSGRASGTDSARTPHDTPVGPVGYRHPGGSTPAGGTARRSWRQLR